MEKIIYIDKNTSGDVINIVGYNYDWLQNVYLSSYSVTFPSLTSIDKFTTLARVSAICPSFVGYLLPVSAYNVINRNNLVIGLSSEFFIAGQGTVDIIFESIAGYTKLSDKESVVLVN
jgi:hypothetical protein